MKNFAKLLVLLSLISSSAFAQGAGGVRHEEPGAPVKGAEGGASSGKPMPRPDENRQERRENRMEKKQDKMENRQEKKEERRENRQEKRDNTAN